MAGDEERRPHQETGVPTNPTSRPHEDHDHRSRGVSHPEGIIPIAGGAPCDRCGNRAFRKTQTGVHRHEWCESAAWKQDRLARRLGRQTRQTARRARKGCKGCCACRGAS